MTKRLGLGKANLTPNFIGSWEMEASICDHIINYYDKQKPSIDTVLGLLEKSSENFFNPDYELNLLKYKFKIIEL